MSSGIDHFGYHTLYGDASNIPLCCSLFFTGAWLDGLDDFLASDLHPCVLRVKGARYVQCPDCIAKCIEGDKKPRRLIKDDRIPNLKDIQKVYRKERSIMSKK